MRTKQEVIDDLLDIANELDENIMERVYATPEVADRVAEKSILYRQAIHYLREDDTDLTQEEMIEMWETGIPTEVATEPPKVYLVMRDGGYDDPTSVLHVCALESDAQRLVEGYTKENSEMYPGDGYPFDGSARYKYREWHVETIEWQ